MVDLLAEVVENLSDVGVRWLNLRDIGETEKFEERVEEMALDGKREVVTVAAAAAEERSLESGRDAAIITRSVKRGDT